MGDVSLAHLFGRLAISMVVVLGLLALAARVMKRRNGMGSRSTGSGRRTTRTQIEIVARQQLSRGSSLTIVRTGDRVLVLGVTESSVTLLRDGEAPAELAGPLAAPTAEPQSPRTAITGARRRTPPWMSAVETMRERTVRRP